MSVAPGTRLGPYAIAGKLGEGGMGEVYRGTDTRLGREVAIKVLPIANTPTPDAIARFEREGRAIAALNHPNICTLFDVGTDAGRPYLVMELLSGASLHQVLAGGPLPVPTLVDHAMTLADALHAAHSRGIIHRDLKPANILLTEHGTIKILDFGLAKADSERAHEMATIDAALTGPGTTLGTLSYMSPEQLRGHAVDARSDLFSLGLVLYEMATARRAFTGKTLAEVSAAILHDEPPAPVSLRADLPEKLDEIILKLLEKDRDLRYQSAAELRGDLKRLKRRDPAPSDISRSGAARAAVTPAPPSSSDAALAVGLARRHPLTITALVLALLAAAGAAWWALRPGSAPLAERPQISIDALTLDGHAGHATISADGRFIAYVRRDLTHASVVVKQLGSNSEVVILPPSTEADYFAPSFSPDGSYVDVLVDARRNPEDNRFIVRIPFLGGAPRRLVERAASGVGWSPDGRHMAFVRLDRSAARADLVVADTNGQHERVLLTVQEPRQLATSFHGGGRFAFAPSNRPAWSPDGRLIAVPGINRKSVSAELIEVEVATGTEHAVRPIEASVSVFAHEVAYVDNARLIASRVTADETQQWWAHPPTGTPVQLTPDLTDVRGVQLTGDRSAGVATRTIVRAMVTVGAVAERTFVEAVAPSASRPFFAQLDSRGRLFYAARVPGEIATFRSDGVGGAGTAIATDLSYAIPSSDGAFVVGFRRNRDLVRVHSDGSGATLLLPSSAIAFPVALTPDGQHLVLVSNAAGPQQPWLLPLDGGEPRRLADINIPAPFMRLSRDGRQTIFPSPDGTQLCRFPTFDQCRTLRGVRSGPFSADGRTVFAIDPTDPRNIIAQPIDGGPPTRLTAFSDMTIEDFSLSPDGSRMAITRAARESDVVLIKGLKSHRP